MQFSTTAKKITANTLYQIIGKAVTMTVTLLITILVTRTYGVTGYGEFNLMQAFPALFFVIIDFGFNAIATRDLSADFSKAEKYLSNILSLRILMSLVIIALLAVVLTFFPYSKDLIF